MRFNFYEKVALSVVALFVWMPLCMAPASTPKVPTAPVAGAAARAGYESVLSGIISGTHLTDWLLVIVGALQFIVLRRQAEISDKQRALMADQSTIARQQSNISHRQVELEEKRFTAEHRPRLLVTKTTLAETDEGLRVQFAVINVGTLPAEIGLIQFAFAAMLSGHTDHRAHSTESGCIPGKGHRLAAGESIGYDHVFKDMTLVFSQRDLSSRCTFSGDVYYFHQNTSSPRFVLGFCRELRGRNPTFMPSEDRNQEYSY